MTSYMIGYDLVRPGKDYQNLIEAIKTYGNWWHCLDSTWIVKSNSTAAQIRDHLSHHVDANDRLLVADLSGNAAWRGFDDTCSNWLKTNL